MSLFEVAVDEFWPPPCGQAGYTNVFSSRPEEEDLTRWTVISDSERDMAPAGHVSIAQNRVRAMHLHRPGVHQAFSLPDGRGDQIAGPVTAICASPRAA